MENEKCYMGIDPGSKGFIAIQKNGKYNFFSIAELNMVQLSDILAHIHKKNENIVCVIEDVHAVYNSSAKSTFQFGFNKGYLVGLLAANHIPYELVPPKKWQKVMWTAADKEYIYDRKVDAKQTSINAATRLFPDIDFRRNDRCRNIDDNKVDAALMAEYARRCNL